MTKGAVYDPPKNGFPFLGVVIMEDGSVTALAFATAAEAQALVDEALQGLANLTKD